MMEAGTHPNLLLYFQFHTQTFSPTIPDITILTQLAVLHVSLFSSLLFSSFDFKIIRVMEISSFLTKDTKTNKSLKAGTIKNRQKKPDWVENRNTSKRRRMTSAVEALFNKKEEVSPAVVVGGEWQWVFWEEEMMKKKK